MRARRHGIQRATTRRGRRLAADSRTDEYEVLLPHWTRLRGPSCGDGSFHCLHAYECPAKERLLFLALPGRNPVGASLETWKTFIRPQPASTEVVGCPVTRAQISASWLLCVRNRCHVRRRNPRFHVYTVRPRRRCQDAESLPRYRGNRGNRHRFAGSAVHADPELLVPVSLSIWSSAWNHIAT